MYMYILIYKAGMQLKFIHIYASGHCNAYTLQMDQSFLYFASAVHSNMLRRSND
jgi:hypothetical protein